MATRYRDSRNKNAMADGDAFEAHIMAQLAQRGIVCRRCVTFDEQVQIGDLCDDKNIGYEIKLDQRCTETGRLSIEIAEKTALDRPWIDSGIFASSQAAYYIQGNTARYWVFRRSDLRDWYDEHQPRVYDDAPPTIKKFYIPIDPMPIATVAIGINWAARKRRAIAWIRTHKTLIGYPYQQEPE